jgi:acyl carrier protein
VKLERMPRTSTGKIDRKALPAPDTARASGVDPIAPRTAIETEIATVFAGVLGLDRVGVNEDFFQLGGHSLLALGLISRLSDRFDIEIPLAALFEFSTVERIARYVEERGAVVPGAPAPAAGPDAAAHRGHGLSEADVDSLLSDVLGLKVS